MDYSNSMSRFFRLIFKYWDIAAFSISVLSLVVSAGFFHDQGREGVAFFCLAAAMLLFGAYTYYKTLNLLNHNEEDVPIDL